ncbi:MAG: AAA family ATPase [Coriobacteriia bacterium]|nr:AAA family ATPase [Coriobacteriia bacterium]
MIDELSIKNLALIEQAQLEFDEHFTVITGETGAGKSAILHAIKLIIGERSKGSLLSEGAEKLEVAARYFFEEEADEEGHIAYRSLSSSNKSRVNIDEKMASVNALKEYFGSRVDFLGQHEHQSLLKAANHADIFDNWIGQAATEAKDAYERAFEERQEALAALEKIRSISQDKSGALDIEREVYAEIDALKPRLGEFEELEEELQVLEHADLLHQHSMQALLSLREDQGALESLAFSIQELEKIVEFDTSIHAYLKRLESVQIELEDISHELRSYKDNVDLDEALLERKRQRHHSLSRIMRKYGPSMEEVLARLETAQKRISLHDDSEFLIQEAEEKLKESEERLAAQAQHWYELRVQYQERFEQSVFSYLEKLEMAHTRFFVNIELFKAEEQSAHQAMKLEFLLAPDEELTPKPLQSIASGGEASRVMLAIKAVMGNSDTLDTIIFDEVDTGIGGSVAHAVADVLEELSQTHQLIVVSHLAQIALKASKHYLVYKTLDGKAQTRVKSLEGQERVQEISRMLAGEQSEHSLKYAEELLRKAGKQ